MSFSLVTLSLQAITSLLNLARRGCHCGCCLQCHDLGFALEMGRASVRTAIIMAVSTY